MFSEYILVVKIRKSANYHLKFCLTLSEFNSFPDGVLSNSFSLKSKTKDSSTLFVFGANSEKEKKVWLDILRKVYVKLPQPLLNSNTTLYQSPHLESIVPDLPIIDEDDELLSESALNLRDSVVGLTHRTPTQRSSIKSFWKQESYDDTLSLHNTNTATTPKKGRVDSRASDVVTPHIESITFIVVAGLLLPESIKVNHFSITH